MHLTITLCDLGYPCIGQNSEKMIGWERSVLGCSTYCWGGDLFGFSTRRESIMGVYCLSGFPGESMRVRDLRPVLKTPLIT